MTTHSASHFHLLDPMMKLDIELPTANCQNTLTVTSEQPQPEAYTCILSLIDELLVLGHITGPSRWYIYTFVTVVVGINFSPSCLSLIVFLHYPGPYLGGQGGNFPPDITCYNQNQLCPFNNFSCGFKCV